MKNIWFVYSGGIPNYGDEMIARVWVDHLVKKFGDEVMIYLDSPHPEITGNFFMEDRQVKVVNTLWSISRQAEGVTKYSKYLWLKELVENSEGHVQEMALTFLKQQVDTIHFLGGGYINSIWNNSILVDLVVAIKECNPAINLYGTGLGLLPADESQLVHYSKQFSAFDYIETRDKLSSQKFGLQFGVDDMWLGFGSGDVWQQTIKQANKGIPEIMVNLQEDFNEKNIDAIVSKLIELIQERPNYSREIEIGVAEAYPRRDGFLYEELLSRIPNPIKRYSLNDLMLSGFPAGKGVFWITSRFHFHLIASGFGSKGIALSGGSFYYNLKHRSLIDLGDGWELVDVTKENAYKFVGTNVLIPQEVKAIVSDILYKDKGTDIKVDDRELIKISEIVNPENPKWLVNTRVDCMTAEHVAATQGDKWLSFKLSQPLEKGIRYIVSFSMKANLDTKFNLFITNDKKKIQKNLMFWTVKGLERIVTYPFACEISDGMLVSISTSHFPENSEIEISNFRIWKTSIV